MNSLYLMSRRELELARDATVSQLRRARASLEALEAQRTLWDMSDVTTAAARRVVRRLERRICTLDALIEWRARDGADKA